MATVQEMVDRLKAFDVKKEAVGVILNNKQAYLDRNKKQMNKGETKHLGMLIGKYRNPFYQQMKEQMNPLAQGNVDLKLTGAFQSGMFMEIQTDDIMITSKDSKASKLEDKYKVDIYGLNAENQQSYNFDVFLPEFMAVFEQKTGLKAG